MYTSTIETNSPYHNSVRFNIAVTVIAINSITSIYWIFTLPIITNSNTIS